MANDNYRPSSTILSAAAAVEIGKIVLNIAEKHHDLKDWQSGHELAFIFDTKKALS